MKKTLLPFALLLSICFISCNKNNDGNSGDTELVSMEKTVASDFGNDIALASYADLKTAGDNIDASVSSFVGAPDATKLEAAKSAWRAMRSIWESSEGYLFGPVDANDYDPKTDTWPTDYAEMDALLADSANHPLTLADIQTLPYSLRGYHPLEYMLWGLNSNKTVVEFTPRQKVYMTGLAADLKAQVTANYGDWTEGGYAKQVITAGEGSAEFPKYFNLFNTMADAMVGICNEVGRSDENTGKIYEPFSADNNKGDSSIVESPYSENSMVDFKNNITGAYNVYLGLYKTKQGKGLTDIVQMYDKSLDNDIKAKFTAAINSFSLVNVSFEKAIFTQRDQLQTIITAIGETRDVLDQELVPFLQKNIRN